MLKHLGIEQAHVGGLSMGGSCTLHFGIRHPEVARSLIIAAAGSGSDDPDEFQRTCPRLGRQTRARGPGRLGRLRRWREPLAAQAQGPSGLQSLSRTALQPLPYRLGQHHAGVQAGRPPIYVWEKQLELIRIPALILCGDEDEACVKPSLFMKRHIPESGLAFFPKSGHGINLEEPDLYNRFCFDS